MEILDAIGGWQYLGALVVLAVVWATTVADNPVEVAIATLMGIPGVALTVWAIRVLFEF
jgi:hypothetical protein